jgi:uncharacterized protein YfaS (alpha-2-macroglobulin family)
VVFGLAMTAEAGYEVDPAALEQGVSWLRDNLTTMDRRTRAFALYSMAVAGLGDEEATLAAAADLDRMDNFSLAALALALDRLGLGAEAGRLLDLLVEEAIVADGLAYWPGDDQDGYYRRKTMASDTRNTALALSAISAIRPGHALEGPAARWLMDQRRHLGWGSTNETAFTIIGLTDHLLATSYSEPAVEAAYAVSVNGAQVAAGAFSRTEPAVTVTIPRSELETGDNSLSLTYQGSGLLYYVVTSEVYLDRPAIEAAGPIVVQRYYRDPESEERIVSATAGELVEVVLVVRMPEAASFMIVEDPLAGGLEALNERLNTTSHVAEPNQELLYYWQDYGYNHKEIRAGRVSFFITEMPKAIRTFTYLARATQSGHFTALPTEVWAMYEPELWGRSASGSIEVRGEE